jgi:hypothetical protein
LRPANSAGAQASNACGARSCLACVNNSELSHLNARRQIRRGQDNAPHDKQHDIVLLLHRKAAYNSARKLMTADPLEIEVKLAVYRITAERARVPTAGEVAGALSISLAEAESAFARLHQKRLLVPEPGDPTRIRMAPPFSGIETGFPVESLGKRYYANCVWDAYGIAAALHADAVIPASDAHTGEPLMLEVKGNGPVPQPYLAHFAVPAAHWWDDIVFT